MVRSQGIWRKAHESSEVESVTLNEVSGGRAIEVMAVHRLASVGVVWETKYTVYGSGDVVVDAQFKPSRTDLPRLPRLGMNMTLPAGFDRITWLGPGPHETYCDRKDAKVGVYNGTVKEQFYSQYTEPGESGNKVDARWIALTDRRGNGLLAVGLPLLSMNALHYRKDDLEAARHPFELQSRESIILNLDWKQQGVGGDNSWGAWPHENDLIECAEQGYRIQLSPLKRGDDPAEVARAAQY
jgi:beta-galactosidase